MYLYDFLFTEVRAVRCNCTSNGCKWDILHRALAGNKPYIQNLPFQPLLVLLFSDLLILIQYDTYMHTVIWCKYILITPQSTLIRNLCVMMLCLCSQRGVGKEAQFYLSTEVRIISTFISVVGAVFRYAAMAFPFVGRGLWCVPLWLLLWPHIVNTYKYVTVLFFFIKWTKVCGSTL